LNHQPISRSVKNLAFDECLKDFKNKPTAGNNFEIMDEQNMLPIRLKEIAQNYKTIKYKQ
jgi:hypothetical protein